MCFVVSCDGGAAKEAARPTPEIRLTPTPTTTWLAPTVVATPDHGPVGTLVEVKGDGFTDSFWHHLNGWDEPGGDREYFGLSGEVAHSYTDPSGHKMTKCDLILNDEYVHSRVSDTGHLTAAFRVGRTGGCFQSSVEIPTPPGEYGIHFTCHSCSVGKFRVTD
jgi:hypothetical protein